MSGTYPLTPDRVLNYSKQFDTIKTYDLFLLEARRSRNTTGNPRRKWVIIHDHISYADMATLVQFFIDRKGKWDSFSFTDPANSQTYTVRFDQDTLSVDKPLGRTTNPKFQIEVNLIEVL